MPDKMPRCWQEKGFVPFWIEVLTPVYIGSNDELSPLDYVIRKKGNQNWLCCIDLQGWLMQNASDISIQSIISKGDVAQIRNMLNEKVDPKLFGIYFRPIEETLARELSQAYGGTLGNSRTKDSKSQKDKKGEVALALRNPANDCPLYPRLFPQGCNQYAPHQLSGSGTETLWQATATRRHGSRQAREHQLGPDRHVWFHQ